MKKLILISILFGAFTSSINAKIPNEKLQVSYNKNIELLGLVYTIIYENPDSPLYDNTDEKWEFGQKIIKEYGHYHNSETIFSMVPAIEHLWISDFLYLLTSVDDFPNATLPDNINQKKLLHFSKTKDPEEAIKNVHLFLNGMNKFYLQIDFGNYLKRNEAFYQTALEEIETVLSGKDFIGTMEALYQHSYEKYEVGALLTLPPVMGFATNHDNKAYNFVTAQSQQDLSENTMGFEAHQKLKELCIHEFGHSLLVPSFYSIDRALHNSSSTLLKPIKESMKRQNYLNWIGVLDEHFVRAGEVIVAKNLDDKESAERLFNEHYENRDFIYLPEIIELLEASYHNRNDYKQAVIQGLELLKNKANGKSSKKVPETINGKVLIENTNTPIPYVHVGIKGKDLGGITREDGTFKIDLSKAEPSDSLSFSSVGYEQYSIALSDIKADFLEIYLKEEAIFLEEVKVLDEEITNIEKFGRVKASKTTNGQNGIEDYGHGGEYGIRIKKKGEGYVLQDVNFHMRFNNTDSILFRINIYDIKDGLPNQSILREELFMMSYKREKWIKEDFSDKKIVIEEDVIVTYDVIKIWYSDKTQNNIFFTYGKEYSEGEMFKRKSSFDTWSKEDSFPIALYVSGRLF